MEAALHTVKGTSRLYQLTDLTTIIHETEEILVGKDNLSPRTQLALEHAILQIEQVRQLYREALTPLLRLKSLLIAEDKNQSSSLRQILNQLSPLADSLALNQGKAGLRLQWDLAAEDIIFTPLVVDALTKSLVHILRNVIDHGLETPEERTFLKKSPEGVLKVFMDQDGRLALQDDGRGLDLERLKQRALERGLGPLTDQALANIIFMPGLSTKDKADHNSGRGIGMDAVRLELAQVGATIDVIPLVKMGSFLSFYYGIRLGEEEMRGVLPQQKTG